MVVAVLKDHLRHFSWRSRAIKVELPNIKLLLQSNERFLTGGFGFFDTQV